MRCKDKEEWQRKKEYGGFLPLELNPGKEYFEKYEGHLGRLNTVKTSIDLLIRGLDCDKIYIPYYYCPTTTEAIKKTGVDVVFYHIDSSLMPIDLPDEASSIILLVDYFGVCGERIKKYAGSIKNAEVIMDFAHSFFEEPIMEDHRHNVYSAKKFFGIPDGSYLISKTIKIEDEELSYAGSYTEYLLKTYEEGTNAAYRMKKEVDARLGAEKKAMSLLSVGLLKNADYARVNKQRRANYSILAKELGRVNMLELPDSCAAYQYPLLITGGSRVKKELIKNSIFVSTLWSGEDLKREGNAFEITMMNDCVFLPIDQRYDENDMLYIADVVNRVKGELQI